MKYLLLVAICWTAACFLWAAYMSYGHTVRVWWRKKMERRELRRILYEFF